MPAWSQVLYLFLLTGRNGKQKKCFKITNWNLGSFTSLERCHYFRIRFEFEFLVIQVIKDSAVKPAFKEGGQSEEKEHMQIRFTNCLNITTTTVCGKENFAILEALKCLFHHFSTTFSSCRTSLSSCCCLRMLWLKRCRKEEKGTFYPNSKQGPAPLWPLWLRRP